MENCVNVNNETGYAWLKEPNEFKAYTCMSCSTYYNYLFIPNNGTVEYIKEINKLQ